MLLTQAVTDIPAGLAIYDRVTQGYPGAEVAPLEFPPRPEGPLMTGRS